MKKTTKKFVFIITITLFNIMTLFPVITYADENYSTVEGTLIAKTPENKNKEDQAQNDSNSKSEEIIPKLGESSQLINWGFFLVLFVLFFLLYRKKENKNEK